MFLDLDTSYISRYVIKQAFPASFIPLNLLIWPAVCKTWQVSTRSRRGRADKRHQFDLGAAFGKFGQLLKLWG